MENEKNPNYDQDGPNPVKEPRTQNLKADPDTYLDMEEEEIEPSNLSIIQKKLADREAEIANLQRKVILLYEELRNKN